MRVQVQAKNVVELTDSELKMVKKILGDPVKEDKLIAALEVQVRKQEEKLDETLQLLQNDIHTVNELRADVAHHLSEVTPMVNILKKHIKNMGAVGTAIEKFTDALGSAASEGEDASWLMGDLEERIDNVLGDWEEAVNHAVIITGEMASVKGGRAAKVTSSTDNLKTPRRRRRK